MKKLNKNELELFYYLDEKKYLRSNNFYIENLLEKLELTSYKSELQNFMNKIVSWYFVKYPDKNIDAILYHHDTKIKPSTDGMNLKVLFQNFDTFENWLLQFDDDKGILKKELCQNLFNLIGYKMIYTKSSRPYFGIIRIKFLFWEFNRLFDLKLDAKIYDDIINRDYSLDNPSNVQLLKKLREKNKIKKTKTKKKKLRHFFNF